MPRHVTLITLLVGLIASKLSLADGLVPIGKILADPNEFHLTAVTVAGTVSAVEGLEPYYIPSGAACYGAYTFMLNDGTGALPVAVLGFCGPPVFRPPPIADGEQVLVEAHIRAPGHDGYYQGLIGVPIPERNPNAVQAIANIIKRAAAPVLESDETSSGS